MKANRSEEMNYEKMSRAMRYHYGSEKHGRKGHLAMVKEKRLYYRYIHELEGTIAPQLEFSQMVVARLSVSVSRPYQTGPDLMKGTCPTSTLHFGSPENFLSFVDSNTTALNIGVWQT
jgi:hypothetical protein